MKLKQENEYMIVNQRIMLFSDWLIDEIYEKHLGAYSLKDLAKSNNKVTRESAELAAKHFGVKV